MFPMPCPFDSCREVHLFAEEFRAGVEDIEIQQNVTSGHDSAALCFEAIEGVDLAGVENLALVVKGLRDEREFRLAEDVADAKDEIERAETGVVADDAVGGNSGADKAVFHISRFIVIAAATISADDEVFCFVGVKQLSRRLDAVFEEEVAAAIGRDASAAKDDGGAAAVDGVDVGVSAIFSRMEDGVMGVGGPDDSEGSY